MRHAAFVLLVLITAAGHAAQNGSKGADSRKGGAAKAAPARSVGDKSGDAGATDGTTVIESALVTVIEQVEIPARIEGVLSAVDVREGQMVEAGAVVARIEDTEVRLTHERAKTDFDIARKQATNDL